MAAILTCPDEFRSYCGDQRAQGRRVALVPTMGALHEGHLSLVRLATKHAEAIALSIFVNPTQFGPGEDLDKYPRDLERDTEAATQAGATVVFAPNVLAMYPKGESTRVSVGDLTKRLCGQSRPGHFEGVATVVSKLFQLTGPSLSVFGLKDYQQYCVVKRLVEDLFFEVEVMGHPIVREADGLALSSRNTYLSAEQRKNALGIQLGLKKAKQLFEGGERAAAELCAAVQAELRSSQLREDYVEVADAETLEPVSTISGGVVLAVAAFAGTTRLIDNVLLNGV